MSSYFIRREKMQMYRRAIVCGVFILVGVSSAFSQTWDTVNIIKHSTYQEINTDGSSSYNGGFPIRLRGVVLNNNEDWLDPTAAYDSGVHLWNLGGQAEIYVQAMNLDGTAWDTDGSEAFDDFGGTSCWMGQNYGNIGYRSDPSYNYTDSAWYSELDRLHLWHPGSTESTLVRTGDLVEVRARGGLSYQGKMNVNEQHSNKPDKDFEIVILDKNFGLPAPADITLSSLKDSNDNFLFDSTAPTREFGGELYQATLVNLEDVWTTQSYSWGTNSDIEVTDGIRTLTLHLGLNDSFDGSELMEVGSHFNAEGILDQKDFSGKGGYRLLVMNASDITPVPEPSILLLMLTAMAGVIRYRK